MAFTVDIYQIAKACAALPEYGVWSVRAELVGGKVPAAGARVTVTLGDLVLSGTVRVSEVYVGLAEAFIVGGADGWGKQVKRRWYRADNGVRLATVAGDLALDAGETLAPLGALDTAKLGYAWIRPEGPASTALNELGRPWFVDLDGRTVIGDRPRVTRSGLKIGAEPYIPSLRKATLTSPDDKLAAFVPGSVITSEGIPTLTIRATEIKISDRKACAEVELQ